MWRSKERKNTKNYMFWHHEILGNLGEKFSINFVNTKLSSISPSHQNKFLDTSKATRT